MPEHNQKLLRSSLPTSWGFVPVPKEGQQAVLSPLPPSDRTPFQNLFMFVATADNGPYLCIPEALKFRNDVCGGEDAIRQYCYKLANEGGVKAAGILGTEVMDNKESTMTECCMFNVRLPVDTYGPGAFRGDDAALATAFISWSLTTEYETFIATYFHCGKLWARFSCQIYLELRDIEWGAKILKDLSDRVNKGEHLGWTATS